MTQVTSTKTMDWHLLWTAAGVIITLGALILGCFKSLSSDIRQVDQRLSRLEGSFEERGKWQSQHYASVDKKNTKD
jgi:hypothetical protein